MNSQLFFNQFLLGIFSIVSVAFAENGKLPSKIVEDLFHYAQDSIERVEGRKIFVKPDLVYIAQGGRIYLSGSDYSFSLPSIYSSGNGLYIEASDEFNIFNLWKCPNCGYWNHNDMNCCQRCCIPR